MIPHWSAVIPNYNGEKTLARLVESVERAAEAAGAPGEIIIADDASADGSLELLRGMGARVRLVESSVNRGFSSNADAGVAASRGAVVILLNNDVVVDEQLIRNALRHFGDPALFAVGFLAVDENGAVRIGRTLPDFKKGMLRGIPAEPAESAGPTFFASGGGAAFSREKLLALGAFDPAFDPFYFEDVDLSYRAWASGMKLILDPACRIVHPSHGVISATFHKRRVEDISRRNQWIFNWKNLRGGRLRAAHLAHLALRVLLETLTLRFRLVRILAAASAGIKKVRPEHRVAAPALSTREILDLFK